LYFLRFLLHTHYICSKNDSNPSGLITLSWFSLTQVCASWLKYAYFQVWCVLILPSTRIKERNDINGFTFFKELNSTAIDTILKRPLTFVFSADIVFQYKLSR